MADNLAPELKNNYVNLSYQHIISSVDALIGNNKEEEAKTPPSSSSKYYFHSFKFIR